MDVVYITDKCSKTKAFFGLPASKNRPACRNSKNILGFIHIIIIFAIYNRVEVESVNLLCKGEIRMDDNRSAIILQIVNLIMGILRTLIDSGKVEI